MEVLVERPSLNRDVSIARERSRQDGLHKTGQSNSRGLEGHARTTYPKADSVGLSRTLLILYSKF